MGTDDRNDSDTTRTRPKTLLERVPDTDPAVLQALIDARVSNKHYSAIGQVAAAWGYFEAIIDTWIGALFDRPFQMVACLTAQLIGHRSRIEAFIALVRVLGSRSKWNDDLEAFAKRVTGVAELRNRTVHDLWDLNNPSKPTRREVTAKRTLRVADVHVSTKELLSLTKTIYALASDFDNMASSIFTELHSSSRGKWPPEHLLGDRTHHRQDKTSPEPGNPPDTSRA